MRVYDIIDRKKKGYTMTKEEIVYLIEGYVKGEIPDYQVAAWLMAVYYQGMTDEELLKNVQMLLIGDSITVDVTDYFYKVLPNSISDTKIGRSTLTGVKVFDEYQTQKKY